LRRARRLRQRGVETAPCANDAGFRAYGGDWLAPVRREDWIYTSSLGVSWTPGAHLSAELSHSYDWVESRIPDTDGRQFTRHLVTVAVKYVF
jgi:hypothetical protein